jgi:uncharacterized phage protein gp47/JayE
MAVTVQSIDELDAELVQQLHAEFTELIQEKYPEVSLVRGPIHDLVHYLAGGIAGAVAQTNINRVQQSNSLLAIENNPELADDELVDAVLSNYLVERKAGVAAQGLITIVVTDNVSVVVPVETTYTANGMEFKLDAAFVAKPTGSELLSDAERELTARGDGTYSFTVPATAVTAGSDGNLRRGVKFTPSPIPARFVTAFAATDFTGGTDTELNAELIKRLQLGVAARVMQGRVNIEALIKSQAQFADTLHYSTIGYGNPEMQRDQHWIFPVSGGGRLDIYARTAAKPTTTTLTKTATLIEKRGTGGVWQFSLAKTDAPGFYDVVAVLLPDDDSDASGFEILLDQRGFDLSGDGVLPDVLTAAEAAYTRFQTAVIQFLDTETNTADLTVGDTADYDVVVRAMPLISELQEFCRDGKVRNLASDVLVKAAVPCFLSINCDIEQAVGETAPDTSAIKTDIANIVNNMAFPGQLHASTIADVIHNYLTSRQAVGPITMHGRIRRPDGTFTVVRNTQILTIPDSPSSMVTGRTVALILDTSDIGISVVTKGFETSD